MIDYKRILQESKDKRFKTIASKKMVEDDSHSCSYSPKSRHKYCTHPHCIFDKEWQDKDSERSLLQNRIKEEESYLKHGEGTVGYDFKEIYKNVLRLKNELKKLL